MPEGYHHLTCDQRCQIDALRGSGQKPSAIARQLCVHRSTVYRELKRNVGQRGYRYKQANGKARERRHVASGRARKMTRSRVALIETKLRCEQWSPRQISGWLESAGHGGVSHERIYQHVWADKKKGGSLWKHLRHNGKKYNKRKGKTAGRGLIPHRIDIGERPAIVDAKERLGDWEGDTIIGKDHKGAIVSLVDRASKLTKLILLPNKTAEAVTNAIVTALKPLASNTKTLTFDNGKEFAGHTGITQALNAACYFAKPYHSWERGLNEHTNGLVRQYFPKGTDFSTLTQEAVRHVENLLNTRPRECLNFKTPHEIFIAKSQQNPIVALHC
jgi:IS30 family transposase